FVLGRSNSTRVFAALAALAIGVPLALSASAGAHSRSHSTRIKGTQAAIAKLPAQARAAVLRDDAVRGRTYFDGLGIRPGKIKHVWLIILENKSYDASFTGLNNNTYLWKTLPSQGVLLKNYYGTGHDSLDNYLSMVSGQAPLTDTQSDCPDYDAITGSIDYSGNLDSNPNYGQVVSAAGPNAAAGQNGCVYSPSVTTLFNQLDAAGVSWKGYAQDLGNPDVSGPTHDAGAQYCGAPYASPGATASTAQPNPGSANATDQYVPKHFPFPWFESLLNNPNDCNAAHIANLFDPSHGLYHDLQSESTTPAFSWITPNNCSDGHDAVCHGNNLSGGFSDPNTPSAPVNYTGGLYAADLFLEHVIPEIEASPAYKDGGLIDVTFDEAFPPFTFTGNSFADSTDQAPNYTSSLISDSAGETLFGEGVDYEPTGPNVPLQTDAQGDELYPGPGFNAYIDRPGDCVEQTVPAKPAGTCLLGSGETPASDFPARTDPLATAPASTSTITDSPAVANPGGMPPTPANTGIQADDKGRAVSGSGIPAGSFVGPVTAVPATATGPNGSPGGTAYTASFELVDANGDPVLTTGPVSGVTLAVDSAQTDPLFTATGETNGGGDTGSVLISSYIKPGTSSYDYYNHYSWLRTMEDLFGVASNSAGLDGLGHIGYAAQPGLAPFGPDVFNDTRGPSSRWGGGAAGHGADKRNHARDVVARSRSVRTAGGRSSRSRGA
ncbi:MAG: alkaline phosphatase family protein, partial [Solirubrobacteraceae bacterium]